MHMHFLVSVPFWVGVIFWVLKILADRNVASKMVQRHITAPDGRQATFVVPVSEPAAISIARMYPAASTVVTTSPGTRHLPPRPPLSSDPRFGKSDVSKMWSGLVVMALFIMAVVITLKHGSGLQPPTAANNQAVTSAPVPASTSVRTLPRIRLKSDANIRISGSRAAAILRVGRKGDTLVKFGEANGWVQVGMDHPEGWVAESVIAIGGDF